MLCALGVFTVNQVNATTVSLTNMFASVSLLGQSIVLNGSAKFEVIDMDGATDHVHTYLPEADENNGNLIIYKRAGTETSYVTIVNPYSGDTIDGDEELSSWNLNAPGNYVTLLGDATNDTWWVVGQSY